MTKSFNRDGHLPALNMHGERLRQLTSVVLWAGSFLWISAVGAHAQTVNIALTGTGSPDGNGLLSAFSTPSLNDAGSLSFSGLLTSTAMGMADHTGVFVYETGAISQVAREGDTVPGDGATFDHFSTALFSPDQFLSTPVINTSGQIAFYAKLRETAPGMGDTGIYLHGDSGLQVVLQENEMLGTSGLHAGMVGLGRFGPSLDTDGVVGLFTEVAESAGGVSIGESIVIHEMGVSQPRVVTGDPAPDGNGVFVDGFTPDPGLAGGVGPVSAGSSRLVFRGELTGSVLGVDENTGIFMGSAGSSLSQIARKGQSIGTGSEVFASFSQPRANRSGQVAFSAGLGIDPSTPSASGVFVHAGVSPIELARAGETPPGVAGTFTAFSDVAVINTVGDVVTRAMSLESGVGEAEGIYLFDGAGGGVLDALIVKEGQTAPEGNGTFEVFGSPSLNGGGQVAFVAGLIGTAGDESDNVGLYLTDSQEQLNVMRTGQVLSGKQVQSIAFASASGGDDGLPSGLNDLGQVAYRADFTDGTEGLFLFTPELSWRSAGSGNWDTASSWTVGVAPQVVHHVMIEGLGGITVTGPGIDGAAVRSLSIGAEGGDGALNLTSGGDFEIGEGLELGLNASLNVLSGVLRVGGDATLMGAFTIDSEAVFEGYVTGPASVAGGGVLRLNGGYSPGTGPATINISGDLVFGGSSELTLELGKAVSTPVAGVDHDRIDVGGQVTLDGTLKLELTDAGTPTIGASYTVMTFSSRAGTLFDQIDGTLINTSLALVPVFESSSLLLRASLPGDTNFDNRVSTADLSNIALAFGTSPGIGSWEQGDFNADGLVTVADLSLLALNFGIDLEASEPATGLSLDVAARLAGIDMSMLPEPGGLCLVMTGLIGGFGRRREL